MSVGGAEIAGSIPLGALADRGLDPARAPVVAAERDPEVSATGRRRTFTAAYKLRILNLAEACTGSGERGALLRREGLYASRLTEWRKARDAGALSGLAAVKRGPAPLHVDPSALEVKQLRRDLARTQAKLQRAELVIEIQKKVAELLGIPLQTPDFTGKT